jgi:hypothetical protein
LSGKKLKLLKTVLPLIPEWARDKFGSRLVEAMCELR